MMVKGVEGLNWTNSLQKYDDTNRKPGRAIEAVSSLICLFEILEK